MDRERERENELGTTVIVIENCTVLECLKEKFNNTDPVFIKLIVILLNMGFMYYFCSFLQIFH